MHIVLVFSISREHLFSIYLSTVDGSDLLLLADTCKELQISKSISM